MPLKTSQVLSWHQSTPEKRMLRKRKLGPPDVYLQEKYHSSILNEECIRKGYQADTMPFEYDSLVYNSCPVTFDRIDEAHTKSTELLALVLQERCHNSTSLDRERRKNKEIIGTRLVLATAKERAAWFAELARGKPLYKLTKSIPRIRRQEESLNYLCDYRVPSFRALWYLKVTAALSGSTPGANLRLNQCEVFSTEYKNIFVKLIRGLIAEMLNVNNLSSSPVYKDRWMYISNLSKCAFEDGIIQRQGFLNGLCDIFFDYFINNSASTKLPLLKVYLLFLAQFLRHVTKNLVLTRRLAHMISMKLRLYYLKYNKKRNRTTRSNEAFTALTKCAAYRSVIHILTVFLQNMVIDAPEAFVWNNLKISTSNEPCYSLLPFCGSPLDLLPCAIHELPLPPGKGSEQFIKLVKLRGAEIVRRSQAVQDNWQFTLREQFPSARFVNVCLDAIGILDSTDILEPGFISAITAQIFCPKSDRWVEEIMIRIKLMLHWAVTAEREGSYRAIIVAKIIRQQIWNQGSHMFGRHHLQEIILNYLDTEAPTPGSKFYEQEFASLIILLIELSRFELFDHDRFVKELIKSGELDYQHPVMEKLKLAGNYTDMSSAQQFEDSMSTGPTDVVQLTYKQGEKDEHAYIYVAMPMTHRVLIQMPLSQSEEHRNEVNQRALLLYGMSDAREKHVLEMRKIAREICKMWRKKIYVQFECEKAPFWKQSISYQDIVEILANFSRQTYYDQAMICGWCAESFSNMIHDFVQGDSLQMPTSEGLDILCGMFETAQHIYGIFELCAAIVPLLSYVEKVIRSLAVDVIPGTVSGQLAYVFVAYISKHWHYFLHSTLAPTITNQLYKIIETALHAYDYPVTSWGRIIAVFVYHSKRQLRKSQLSDIKLHGVRSNFRTVFNHGSGSHATGDKYNALFFKDVFQKKLRFFSYHEYKKRLPSFGQLHNRNSFVMNSFIAAKGYVRDYHSLCELATFCGHISAQIPQLADDWVAAIVTLCCPDASHTVGYSELLAHIDVSDCSTHYPIATFVMLLAGKYAFSVPRLIAELSNSVLPNVMKSEHTLSIGESEFDYGPGACMALHILAKISCAADDPFHLPQHHVGEICKKKLLPKCADEIILSLIHWCELDNVLFPILTNIFTLMDSLRSHFKDLESESSRSVDSTKYSRDYLVLTLKAVKLAICKEDWVTIKMFRIAETNRMEAFNHESLKRNCIGQQLLHCGLRRRSERDFVLVSTSCSGHLKKEVIHNLLSTLNMWNMRATLFELALMFKEVPSENVAEREALMITIVEWCRDLVFDARKENLIFSPINMCDFRFHHITNYWLTAFLLQLSPQLANESRFQHTSVLGKYFEEVLSILDSASDKLKDKQYQNMFLPSRRAFLNIVLGCLRREDSQTNKDFLLSLLYTKLRDFLKEVVKNRAPLQEISRIDLLLLLPLIGRISKEINKPRQNKRWSQLLLKVMSCGIASVDRYRVLHDSCYDMLCILILSSLTTPSIHAQHFADESGTQFESVTNSVVMKILNKEIIDQRLSSELHDLLRLFLLPKRTISVLEMKPCRAPSAPPNVNSSSKTSPALHGRCGLRVVKKLELSNYDLIDTYTGAQSTMDGWRWCWFQASIVDRSSYSAQKWVSRLLPHKHQSESQRSNVVIGETNRSFLIASDMETSSKTSSPSDSLGEALAAAEASDSAVKAIASSSERAITSLESTTTIGDMRSVQDNLKTPSLGCKRASSYRHHTSTSKRKKARLDCDYTGSSSSSLDQSETLCDVKSAPDLTSHMRATVEHPTRTKILECINRRMLGAAQSARVSETQQQIPQLYYPHAVHPQVLGNAQSSFVQTSCPGPIHDWYLPPHTSS